MPALEKWVARENIPTFLGGKSAGTLVDDVGPWSDSELVASLGINLEDLRGGGGAVSASAQHALAMPAFGRVQPVSQTAPGDVSVLSGSGPSGLRRPSDGFFTPMGSMDLRADVSR